MAADTLTTAQYTIDAAKSRFTVTAYASGLLSGLGHNPVIAIRDFAGQISFAPEELSKSSLEFLVKAESLVVSSDVSDKDRREIERNMKDNVLEAGRYPEIVFDSTEVSGTRLGDSLYALRIQGGLSLHGVTHMQLVVAQMVPGDDIAARIWGVFNSSNGFQYQAGVGGRRHFEGEGRIEIFVRYRGQKTGVTAWTVATQIGNSREDAPCA